MSASLDPKRTVAELKELRTLTGDANGALAEGFIRFAKERAMFVQWADFGWMPFSPTSSR